MARAKLPDLSPCAHAGAEFAVRATPGARRTALSAEGEVLRVAVTAPPEGGRANEAVRTVLAGALGVAKTRLTLLRGASSRDKMFRLD